MVTFNVTDIVLYYRDMLYSRDILEYISKYSVLFHDRIRHSFIYSDFTVVANPLVGPRLFTSDNNIAGEI